MSLKKLYKNIYGLAFMIFNLYAIMKVRYFGTQTLIHTLIPYIPINIIYH